MFLTKTDSAAEAAPRQDSPPPDEGGRDGYDGAALGAEADVQHVFDAMHGSDAGG